MTAALPKPRFSCCLLAAAAVWMAMLLPAMAADKRTPPPDLGKISGPEAQAFYLGLNAVIWGYPAVFFEDLMRGRTDPDAEAKTGNPRSLVNQLGLVRHLRGPEFKQIATPNNDTLYAQGFCDVSREPLVISVPAIDADRYYVIQLWDVNGDTFGGVPRAYRTASDKTGHPVVFEPEGFPTADEGLIWNNLSWGSVWKYTFTPLTSKLKWLVQAFQ